MIRVAVAATVLWSSNSLACEPFGPDAPKREIIGNTQFLVGAPVNGKLGIIVCSDPKNPLPQRIKHSLGSSPGLEVQLIPGECILTTTLAKLETINVSNNKTTKVSFCVLPFKVD